MGDKKFDIIVLPLDDVWWQNHFLKKERFLKKI